MEEPEIIKIIEDIDKLLEDKETAKAQAVLRFMLLSLTNKL